MLEVEGLCAGYGKKQVLFNLTLRVGVGETVAVFGHNGAGKTTLLRAIFGTIPKSAGRVTYQGQVQRPHASPRDNRRKGMALIPSERFVFPDLTVMANLQLGGLVERSRTKRDERLAGVLAAYPVLGARTAQLAGTLSGGEARQLVLGMSLMTGPKLMLLDEPSLGLAPALVTDLFGRLHDLVKTDGTSIVLLEQNVRAALAITDRIYVLRSGSIVREEPAAAMLARPQSEWWTVL